MDELNNYLNCLCSLNVFYKESRITVVLRIAERNKLDTATLQHLLQHQSLVIFVSIPDFHLKT